MHLPAELDLLDRRDPPDCCVPPDLLDSAEFDLDLLRLFELPEREALRDRFDTCDPSRDLLYWGEFEADLSKPYPGVGAGPAGLKLLLDSLSDSDADDMFG